MQGELRQRNGKQFAGLIGYGFPITVYSGTRLYRIGWS